MAQLHADHHQNAAPHERAVARTIALLAHPRFIGGLAIFVVAWMTLNLLAAPLGYPALDPPPFSWLGGAVSLASLYMVVLILATQRREDQLTQRREQLTLQLAILSEQKTAKIIQLLEESRRDNPQVQNRHDPEAEATGSAGQSGIGARSHQRDPRKSRAARLIVFGDDTLTAASG